MKLRVSLPWPPQELWPNRKAHWRTKAAALRSYKRTAWALAYRNGPKGAHGPVNLAVTFHPPTAAKRDLDNMLAAIKAGIDGIACALGIDDSRFTYTLARGEPTPMGSVEVDVETA